MKASPMAPETVGFLASLPFTFGVDPAASNRVTAVDPRGFLVNLPTMTAEEAVARMALAEAAR